MAIDDAINKVLPHFESALSHLQTEYGKLQIGRANPSLVENVTVDVYGSSQPLKAVASVSVPDPRTLQIQPWDKANLGPIEKAVLAANLGLNPVNDGLVVRISIPPLTEERRAEIAKVVHKLAEEAKISIRNSRQDAIKDMKSQKESGDITEDELHGGEKRLQDKVDDFNKKVEDMALGKEKDVMTI